MMMWLWVVEGASSYKSYCSGVYDTEKKAVAAQKRMVKSHAEWHEVHDYLGPDLHPPFIISVGMVPMNRARQSDGRTGERWSCRDGWL